MEQVSRRRIPARGANTLTRRETMSAIATDLLNARPTAKQAMEKLALTAAESARETTAFFFWRNASPALSAAS